MTKALSEAELKLRDEAKAKLYVGNLEGLKQDLHTELAALGTDEKTLLTTIQSYMLLSDRDGTPWMRSANEWAPQVMAQLSHELHGNEELANKALVMVIIETHADQMFKLMHELEQLKGHGARTPAVLRKESEADKSLTYMGNELVEMIAPIAGLEKEEKPGEKATIASQKEETASAKKARIEKEQMHDVVKDYVSSVTKALSGKPASSRVAGMAM